jgi:hypothetical protein
VTSGARQQLERLLRTGYALAQGSAWPQWYPGTEFKAARDATLAVPASKH